MSTAAYPIVPTAATALDLSDESAIATLQRAATGPVNPGYYLPIFARFEVVDRGGPSWNWAACLCTLHWMVFRKLWGPALLYLGALLLAALLVFGVGPALLQLSDTERLSMLVALATFAFLVPGVFGNAMLYAAHRRRIAQALAASATLAEACVLLNRGSSSRQRLLGLAVAHVACAGIACALWLALPRSPALPATGSDTATRPRPPARQASAPAAAAVPITAAAASAAAADTPAMAASVAARAAAPTSTMPAPVPAAPASAPPAEPALNAAELEARADALRAYVARRAVAVPPMPTPPSAPLTAEEAAARATALARYVPRRHAMEATVPDAATSAAAASVPARAAAETPARAASAAAATKPHSTASAAAASAAAPAASVSKAPSEAPAGDTAFFINVGLFAEADNARKAHARLAEAGLPALSQELEFPRGKRTRVRVGPFDNRADADAAALKIRALQLEAQIVRPQRGCGPPMPAC